MTRFASLWRITGAESTCRLPVMPRSSTTGIGSSRFWSVYDKAFWPDESDPRIRILRVTPESAEFWEGEGAVVTAVKLVAATVSGARMNLGANHKVEFDAR